MEIFYKKLTPEFSQVYRALRLESLKNHPECFGADYEDSSKQEVLYFEKVIQESKTEEFIVGAFDGELLVGICGFVNRNNYDLEKTGTIIQMYVKKSYSGNKIGFNLLRAVNYEAFKLPSINKIILEVKNNNLSAIKVYQQVGYKNIQEKLFNDGACINNDPKLKYMIFDLLSKK